MSLDEVAVVCCASAAVLLISRPHTRLGDHDRAAAGRAAAVAAAAPTGSLLRRWRWVASLLAGLGAMTFVAGPVGPVAGVAAAVASWVTIGRGEDPAVRRARTAAEADLPHLVLLFAAALRSGAPPSTALSVSCGALPGAAAQRLEGVRARLALGVDAADVWGGLVPDPVLAPLARSMARAARSGAQVADAVDRLSDDLSRAARARSEDRARAVGVKAALPLGLCLLPAFLLIGIVPVVAGLFSNLVG